MLRCPSSTNAKQFSIILGCIVHIFVGAQLHINEGLYVHEGTLTSIELWSV